MKKKMVAVLLCFYCVFCLSGCLSERGIYGIAALETSLKRVDPEYAFDSENAVYDGNAYCFFYSFVNNNDVAIKISVDETQKIRRVTVSMKNNDISSPTEKFMMLCKAVSDEFFPDDEARTVPDITGLFREDLYFGSCEMRVFKGEERSAVFIDTEYAVSFSVVENEEN